MAKTRAQREAEERLRKNNERIYRETGYDPDGWRERTAEIARTERNFAQPSRPKNQKNFTYLKNTKRNAQDRVRNIDPYAWQNRDYGTQEDDGFRWDFGLTGILGIADEIGKKKKKEAEGMTSYAREAANYGKAQDEDYQEIVQGLKSASSDDEKASLNAGKKAYDNAYDAAGYQIAAQNAADYTDGVKKGAQMDSDVNRWATGKANGFDVLFATGKGDEDKAAYSTMTQEELDTYRYWLSKNTVAAQEYLKALRPQLIDRASGVIDEKIEGIDNEAGKKVVRGFTTFAGAAKNAGRGLENIPAAVTGSENVKSAGMIETAQQKMAQRLEGPEAKANELIYNVTQMIPTAALSIIPGAGQAAAAGYTAARSFGGTYADTIEQGYAADKAQLYAAANAASEAGIQYLMTGIAKIGGSKGLAAKLSGLAKKAAANPAAAKGLSVLGNMTSEAAEEYVQANLDPVLRNITLGENNEIDPTSQDKIDAAIMGALMSLGMNAPAEAVNISQTARTGRAYNSPEVMQELVQQGLASGTDTAANRQAQRLAGKLDADQAISNFEAGSLAQANETAIAAEQRANAILDRAGTQRAYNPSETVKLANGTEAVVVARDGDSYVVQEPGKQGYSRVSADSITGKVQSVSPQADRSIAPENRAALNEKYDHRHVEKLADQAFLDKLEQGRGIKAVIEDMQPGAEAFYDRSTNTIHFAPDSTRADVIGGVAAHELAHAAEASEHYKAYSDYAVQRLFGNDAEALRQAIEAKQEQYVQQGVYLSDADAAAEIVADYTRNLYKSPADIDALVTGNRGMAQNIYDAIRTAIQKIRAFFKGDEAALRNIREYQDLRRAQRLFERALSTIPEVQTEVAPAYSVNKSFAQQVDEVLSNPDGRNFETSHLMMGDTPQKLVDLGMKQLPMLVTSRHIWTIANEAGSDSNANYHGLGADMVKQLPQAIDDPAIIMVSKTRPNDSVVLLTELIDRQGRPVLAAIRFDGRGRYNNVQIDANVMTSAYGRTGVNNFVKDALEENRILDVNKEKSQFLEKSPGVQFPDELYKTSFEDNIARFRRLVNGETRQYSAGKMQKNNEDIQSLLSHGRQLPEASRDDVFVTDIIPQTDGDVNRQYSLREDGAEVLTENPERGTRKALDRLAEEYGTITEGETPIRKSNLPNRTSENRYLSEYARTLYEANATNENILPALESKITEEDFSHERISNQRILDNLQKTVDRNGIDALRRQWDGLVSDTGARIARAEDIAAGQYLYNEYVKAGDYDSAIRMAVELSAEATRAGQTVQAFRILKKLSPDGQLYAMEQMADKINRELAKKLRDKAPTIEIDSRLERNLLQAKTKEEIDSAVDAIKQNIADQMPATWIDKLNAWRYLSMLGNPRTHIRNIVGNAIFVPVRQFKNLIGTGLERAANVDQAQRTKSLLNPKKDKAYIEEGKKSFRDVQDILKGNEKYGTGDLNERRTIFKTKLLEAARKLNFKLLEFGDMVFMRSAYVRSYAQAMKARGINAETMTAAQERSVSEYAMNEALKATYRDYNALAAGLNQLKRKNKITAIIGEGLMPFTKTPMNVLKRGVEYSPAGVAKGIYEALHDVRNGTKTAAEAIDTISAGLSGTGVMALGAFLASQGLIVGGSGDDDNEAALDKLTGGQNYAIQIGDKSYTIDFAAPVSMPLFVGVELYNTMQTGNAGASFKNILDSITKISDPLFNLSMLSSINSAIEAAKYSGGSPLADIGINIVTSYAGQFIPTVLGQFARIADDTVRKTYYDKNSGLPKAVDSLLQGALKKIPGASAMLQPSVDRWGREIKSGNVAERILENLISPGYYSERKITNVDKEIDRLYQQIGDSAVIPPAPSKYITVDGNRIDFSAEEYTKYSKLLGQAAYDAASSTVNSEAYVSLTDREKAEAIMSAYDYARETAKAEMSDYEPAKWVTELQNAAVNRGLYFSLKAKTKDISNAYDLTTGEKVENTASLAIKDAIDETSAADSIKRKLYDLLGVNKSVQSGKVTWDDIDKANLSWDEFGTQPVEGTGHNDGQSTAPTATIPEAAGYDIPNYKADTLSKISSIGVSPEDYAYIDDRIGAHEDKVAYLQELGFTGKQLSGLVESFVMGDTAKAKMLTAEEEMNIDNGTYIDAYIYGYSTVGSKSERNAQIREYVNGLPLSDEQKSALYEWVKVYKGKNADGSQTGGSSGGSSGGRRRSGGSSKAASQAIPDSVWNTLRSNVKAPSVPDNPVFAALLSMAEEHDSIMQAAMERDIAAVDANPFISSEAKAEQKKKIRERYGKGAVS